MISMIARIVLTVLLAWYMIRQVRKPSRWIGQGIAWVMNRSHAALTDWGLGHVTIGERFTVLDVGCGGGRTIETLSEMAPSGKIFGVDYASGSVAASRRRNAALIAAGRVDIRRASVSQLPFENDTFDLVTAVETQYYWPDPANDMRGILRVLKPGGTFLVIAESYAGGRFDRLQRPVMALIGSSHFNLDQQRQLFSSAGFIDVQVFEEPKHGWMCAVGRKSPVSS